MAGVKYPQKVYGQCILPVLTYAAKTWRIRKKLEKMPRNTHNGTQNEWHDIEKQEESKRANTGRRYSS